MIDWVIIYKVIAHRCGGHHHHPPTLIEHTFSIFSFTMGLMVKCKFIHNNQHDDLEFRQIEVCLRRARGPIWIDQ